MAKKNDTPPQRYCPECDLNGTHPTTEGVCPRCGFVFLTSPERVEWFPSEEGGVEFGVAEDTPLWRYLEGLADYHGITEDSDADQQPAPQKRGRGKAKRDEMTPQKWENRLAALGEFYSTAIETEIPYEEGVLTPPQMKSVQYVRDNSTTPAEGGIDLSVGIGPNHAPPVRGDDTPRAAKLMMHDPS